MTTPREKGPMEKILNDGESLKDLSVKTGIPYETLKSYNQKKREPSFKNAIAIARAQNLSLVTMGEIFGYEVKGLPYA
jgi:hypothetical protein